VRNTLFLNNLHQVRSKSKDWKAKLFKVLGAIKPKGLNRIAKIGYGHLCLSHYIITSWQMYIGFYKLLNGEKSQSYCYSKLHCVLVIRTWIVL